MQSWALHPTSHHDMRMDRHSVSGETAGQTEKTTAGTHSHLASTVLSSKICMCLCCLVFLLLGLWLYTSTVNPQPVLMMIDDA